MRLHDFTMVINSRQLLILKKLLKITKHKRVNDLITFMLIRMLPYLKKKHLNFKCEKSIYKKVNWTKKLHVLLLEKDFNFLKLLHVNLETYSIAQIIREIIEIVFKFYDSFGEQCFVELDKFLAEVKKDISKHKTMKKNTGQLSNIFYKRIDYNRKYEAICIQIE